ncbi:MAG: sugar phosphate isomerase/epimerase [Firmicutes bacterium]|nr:sugar phosphate isomerase/epimerase [Bacillota bacterium]
MKIALQLYSLRELIKTEEDVIATLTQVKKIGYQAVQLSGIGRFTEEKVELFSRVCKDLGLEIMATHVDFNQLKDEFEDVVRFQKALGATYLGIGAMPDQFDRKNLNHYQDFIFEMNKLSKKLLTHQIKLVYHNHAYEFAKYGSFIPMNIIIQNISKNSLTLEPDLYWLQFAGVNPTEFIRRYRDFIEIIHIKDMRVKQLDKWSAVPQFASIGDGNMGYPSIIEVIQELDFPWVIIEQDDFYGADPFVEIANSLKFVKGL